MCSLKGLNTGLRADAAQGKGCVQEEIFMSRSAKNDKTKTNVMRLLDAAKIPYEAKEYPVDENDLSEAMRRTCWVWIMEACLRPLY